MQAGGWISSNSRPFRSWNSRTATRNVLAELPSRNEVTVPVRQINKISQA
jgi:hypothetical protein